MVLLFSGKYWIDFSSKENMNLQQIKSKASLDQLILIQKIEELIRSEYSKDELLKEIRKEYLEKVEKSTMLEIEKFLSNFKGQSYYMSHDLELFRNFIYRLGDIIRES